MNPLHSSSEDLPTAMTKCFIARFQSALCHIEVAETQELVKATPWVQDRQIIRPVLNTSQHQPEFLAHDEGAALFAVIGFLEERFGSMAEPPRPCPARQHTMTRALPLAWTDELTPTGRP